MQMSITAFWKPIFILCLIHLIVLPCQGDIHESAGLRFAAHTVVPEKRTSLDLTPDGGLKMNKGFTLSFDLKLRREEHNFGYILRTVINDTLNVDLVSNAGWGDQQLSLITGMKAYVEQPFIDYIPGFDYEKWIRVSLKFDCGRQEIVLDMNGLADTVKTELPKMKSVSICFGRNEHPIYSNTDVPPMSIKDIEIMDWKGRILHRFPLLEHGDGFVIDEIGGQMATTENAIWEIDSHLYWRVLQKITVDGNIPQVTWFENKDDRGVYVATQEALYRYSVASGKIDTISYLGGRPYPSTANAMLYDEDSDKLISYSVEDPYLNRFDISSRKWERTADTSYFSLLHHNSMIIPKYGEIVMFGGYDHYRYSSSLYVHGMSDSSWEQHDMSSVISPRYLAAMAYDGEDKIYILGGYGSRTGIQWESPANYYDLYTIDLDTYSAERCWDFSNDRREVFGNRMVIDRDNGCIYALSFDNDRTVTEIRLNSFGLESPSRKRLADGIPFSFYDLHSWCTLVLDSRSEKFLAVTVNGTDHGKSEIKFFGLDYPPMDNAEIIQHQENQDRSVILNILLVTVIIVIAAGTGVTVLYKKTRKQSKEPEDTQQDINTDIIQVPTAENISSGPVVNLFGNFRYLSAEGKDETTSFTHLLRNIFAYIVISECKDGTGVTSKKLDDVFWDCDDPSVTANKRNVAMGRLRSFLKNKGIGDLVHKNGLWSISFKDGVTCDFTDMLPLLSGISKKKDIDIAEIEKIISIGNRGTLLANIEEEWCDSLKSWWLMLISESVQNLYGHAKVKNNPALLIRLSDMMLLNDNLDEFSVRVKCSSLWKMGKTGQAKSCFENFRSYYNKLMGQFPDMNFEEILSM